ncbi:hypothetical protein PR202_gb03994 [Eleusine coracana subsp. coracana]|uniref:Uncharacterized protein n=1 Tax=Eleusine coracana subsp. coracana TaxID=191504 RepID=A0AAV5E0Y7_ELECO|nr:hypothetical protein PR202_gb03994 [Eleusine coracana subsp. coracana]
MVGAGSPGRVGVGSPSRQVPRFAGGSGTEPTPTLDRRDPMSRSARRHRQPSGIGDEILQRASVSSSPPRSDPFAPPRPRPRPPPSRQIRAASPASMTPPPPNPRTAAPPPPPPHPTPPSIPATAAMPPHPPPPSPPTGSTTELPVSIPSSAASAAVVEDLAAGDRLASRSTKLVLSDASKSVSSIVAAICYAWILASKGDGQAAVPVVNMRRSRMARCRQAAWLLYHVGVDTSALLFADEVDMEGLIMDQQVSLFVVGQDVLKPKAEVGSLCTVLTNNYCEDACSLLQSLDIKKLLVSALCYMYRCV